MDREPVSKGERDSHEPQLDIIAQKASDIGTETPKTPPVEDADRAQENPSPGAAATREIQYSALENASQ